MKTGSQVYGEIETSLQQAHSMLAVRSQDLALLQAELETLNRQMGDAYRSLAGVRFEELENRRVHDRLDAADHEALALATERDAARARLERDITASQAAQAQLQVSRIEVLKRRDAAIDTRSKRIDEVMGEVALKEDYRELAARADQAEAVALHSQEKAEQAKQDRIEKGKPYESCRLFSYLWKRRYRFPEYKASYLIRALDDWVAKLCRYDRAHRDYALLIKLPERLSAHSEMCAIKAGEEESLERAYVERALKAAGVAQLEQAVQDLETELLAAEERLETEEDRGAKWVSERAAIDAGTDPWSLQARAILEQRMRGEDVETLKGDARATATHRDDLHVDQLADLKRRLEDTAHRKELAQRTQQEALARVSDLEEVRRRFRRERFDSVNSSFERGIDTQALLGGLLRGAVVLADVLGQFQRGQRFRTRYPGQRSPTGSLPTWRSRGPTFGGNMPKLPKPRSSGGGFGGFGGSGGGGGGSGGGFRTGGGF